MCTHDGDGKPEQYFNRGDLWDIPQQIEDWLDPEDGPWIFNLDLDYFFWWAGRSLGFDALLWRRRGTVSKASNVLALVA